jgi:hypothetical protein
MPDPIPQGDPAVPANFDLEALKARHLDAARSVIELDAVRWLTNAALVVMIVSAITIVLLPLTFLLLFEKLM